MSAYLGMTFLSKKMFIYECVFNFVAYLPPKKLFGSKTISWFVPSRNKQGSRFICLLQKIIRLTLTGGSFSPRCAWKKKTQFVFTFFVTSLKKSLSSIFNCKAMNFVAMTVCSDYFLTPKNILNTHTYVISHFFFALRFECALCEIKKRRCIIDNILHKW